MKVNWDEALETSINISSFGGIIPDLEGELQASMCSNMNYFLTPIVAMAIALSKIIVLTLLTFEGDCQLLVKASYGARCKEILPLVHDIQYLLHHQPGWQLRFVPRD